MSKSKQITENNTIFYSTANAGYAVYAAVSLLTIREYLPGANLCILSSGLNNYDKKILNKHNIDYYEIDLSDKFTQAWDYPIDCYYIFAGPEMFCKQGYEYSVYVDGDVLCASDPLQGIGEVEFVAGVESAPVDGKYISIFGQDWDAITKQWRLDGDTKFKKRINAGVVYFNNSKMQEICLLDKAVELYQSSLRKGMPRKGDDSLFSLMQYVYFDLKDIKILPSKYNFVLQFDEWNYPVKDLIFFHFSIDKPWKVRPYAHEDGKLSMFNPYVKTWRRKFISAAPAKWLSNKRQALKQLASTEKQ